MAPSAHLPGFPPFTGLSLSVFLSPHLLPLGGPDLRTPSSLVPKPSINCLSHAEVKPTVLPKTYRPQTFVLWTPPRPTLDAPPPDTPWSRGRCAPLGSLPRHIPGLALRSSPGDLHIRPHRLQVLESDSVTLKEAPLPGVYAGCSLIFPLLLQLDALLIPRILFVVYKFSGALLPPTLLP